MASRIKDIMKLERSAKDGRGERSVCRSRMWGGDCMTSGPAHSI